MAEVQSNGMPYLDPHNMAMLGVIGTLVGGRPFHEFSIHEQRELFRKIQSPAPKNPGVSVSEHMVKTSHGEVKTYVFKPDGLQDNMPFVFYVHGGGWIFGGAVGFEAFVTDLVLRTGLAVVFPEYTLAPEKKFPVQQEQCLEVLQDIFKNGDQYGLAVDRIVLGGDSVGCQLISAMSILNRQRSMDLPIVHQFMLHPYCDGTAERRGGIMGDPVWAEQQLGAYFSNVKERTTILAAPGLMTIDEAKEYMPATTLIVSDQDPFKDENEAFGRLLQTAGVPCGVLQAYGSVHAVEIFHTARESPTAQLIMAAISGRLREVMGLTN